MSILDGNIFKHFKDIRSDGEQQAYEARIPVFMMLISAANKRLRTWHSVNSIMECTGYSKTPVTEALAWLESRGAIYNVPKEARSGHESRIHGNRKVWQLTGIIKIGEQIVDYLFIKDEDRQSSLLEIEDHAPGHVKMLFRELGLLSEKPEIGLQDEPNLGLQNDTQIIEIGLQTKPEIGLQNDTAKELSKENLVKAVEISKEDEPPLQVLPQPPLNEDLAKVIQSYERWIGAITSGLRDTLLDWLHEYNGDWICDAFEESAKSNVRKLNYAKAILERWQKEGREKPQDDVKAKADAIARERDQRTIQAYEELKRKEAEAIRLAEIRRKAEAAGEGDNEPKQRAS